MPDFEKLNNELNRKEKNGVTRTLLWLEYIAENSSGYSLSQFNADGHAECRYINLGPEGRGIVAVVEDGDEAGRIEEGEQVITSWHYSLAHEAPVAVVN